MSERDKLLKEASQIADEILSDNQKPKRCRHTWDDTKIHETEHWMNGEKHQECLKCHKERWVKI